MSFFKAGLTQTNAVLADGAMVLRLIKLVVNLFDASASTKKICYFKDLFSATRFKIVVNICTANALLPMLGNIKRLSI